MDSDALVSLNWCYQYSDLRLREVFTLGSEEYHYSSGKALTEAEPRRSSSFRSLRGLNSHHSLLYVDV